MKSMPQLQKGSVLIPIIIGSVVILLIGIIAATASNPQSQKALQKGYEEGQEAAKNKSGQESGKQESETTNQKSNISPSPTPKPTAAATSTPKPTQTPTAAKPKGPLNPPRESQIEGVPIPFTAEDAGLKPSEGSLVVQKAGYRVKEASFLELKDWYEGLMPKGQPWGDWWWCPDAPKGGQTFDQRTYGSFDRGQLLVVGILADDPPSILISVLDEEC